MPRRRGGSLHGRTEPHRSTVSTNAIFEPLSLGALTLKNRVLRSSVAGRFDNYDGSGTAVRMNWDVKFARGGVGAIISSNAPIHERGHIVPGYAYLDTDERMPFWRELGKRVHEHDCRYIVQLVFAGRERILPGLRYESALGATDDPEPINGFPCRALTTEQIREVTGWFVQASRRVREAGLDGIELAGANGMLFTQFLSPAINTRKDDYGGTLQNRARFALDVVRAIRREVGSDFCLGFKISVDEAPRELLPWLGRGNPMEDVVRVCGWLEEAGVDYIHVSAGTGFPHPRNPAGRFPVKEVVKTYDTVLSSGPRTLRNYVVFRTWPLSAVFRWWWQRPAKRLGVEGINLPGSRAVKQAVSVPVLCTGGFQTASVISGAIERGDCDGVTIARPLVANPDLVRLFEQGHDSPPRPCTYCNKCLFNFIENPLGCYEESRFDSPEAMVREILSVFEEPSYSGMSMPTGVV